MKDKGQQPPRPPVLLSGVMRGPKTIELDEESGLPDGSRIVLRVLRDEEEAEAEATLQTIYRMRHSGRSVIRP